MSATLAKTLIVLGIFLGLFYRPPTPKAPIGTFHEFDHVASALRTMPVWPTDRDFTDDEWSRYLHAAAAFQMLDACDQRMAVLAYQYRCMLDDDWAPEATARLAVLYRLVYDIPPDFMGQNPEDVPDGLFPASGLTYAPHAPDDRLAVPIAFDGEGRPSLSHRRVQRLGALS